MSCTLAIYIVLQRILGSGFVVWDGFAPTIHPTLHHTKAAIRDSHDLDNSYDKGHLDYVCSLSYSLISNL